MGFEGEEKAHLTIPDLPRPTTITTAAAAAAVRGGVAPTRSATLASQWAAGTGRSTARRDADRCDRSGREHLPGVAAPGCQRVASQLSSTVRCGGARFLERSKQAIGIKIQFPVMNPCFAIVLDFSVWYMNNLLPSSKIVSSQYASNCSNTWDKILITT